MTLLQHYETFTNTQLSNELVLMDELKADNKKIQQETERRAIINDLL